MIYIIRKSLTLLLIFLLFFPITSTLKAQNQAPNSVEELILLLQQQIVVPDILKEAILTIPRDLFLPAHLYHFRYQNRSIYVGDGIVLPSFTALISIITVLDEHSSLDLHRQNVNNDDKNDTQNESVLLIGTGCGYLGALLANTGISVYIIELSEIERLKYKDIAQRLGLNNMHIAPTAELETFETEAHFTGIILHGNTTVIPHTITSMVRNNSVLIASLMDEKGSHVMVLYKKESDKITLSSFGYSFFPGSRSLF